MEVEVAVAKVARWAAGESGDTLEMIERPRGGLSFVLVDGQRSGRAAKAISNLVARKAIAELSEGVRDGAAARAAHDYLYTYKGGKVSATLNIVSLDLNSHTLVISRNNPAPAILLLPDGNLRLLDEPSQPVGIYAWTRPVMSEVEIQLNLMVVVYTDGLSVAGENCGGPLDIAAAVREIAATSAGAAAMADGLLQRALTLEEHRPRDDISILVLRVSPQQGGQVRRLLVSVPID